MLFALLVKDLKLEIGKLTRANMGLIQNEIPISLTMYKTGRDN